ncbi:asparagine synthase (glutamine-hydrolyzing) [Streptomyces lavendofoliae]|uniref:asparagine synthase (glutamine-hydrolyzing) n=1 Tax=Streptomyces lavendofoliae TaxID=67314 RepID=UPI00300F608E
MCGVFGCVDWGTGPDPGGLALMAAQLHHRGPDEDGTYTDAHVAFGCKRLSIVDLAGGGQPFFSEDGSVAVVCNGEIFNHRQLRDELAGRHRFRSQCDVEVIVHLYEERGMELVHALNGQFAFALHDRRRDTVFLARDHFGICPLYYRPTDDGLLFASEIKAIHAGRGGPSPALDLTGLDQVLCLPALVPPRTMFEGVRSLRPGHYLQVTPAGATEHEYWDLEYPSARETAERSRSSLRASEAEYRERILAALRRAVRARLQADAPIGLYVSGGLDSALVAALAAEAHDGHVSDVFSVGFTDSELDESSYQRLVADRLGYPQHRVEVSADDICRHLERTVWHSETPLRESYNVASLLLAAAARESGTKVVLAGEGSDEFFAGYSGYRFDALRPTPPHDVPAEERAHRERLWGDPDYGYDLDFRALDRIRNQLYSAELRSSLEEFSCTGPAAPPLVDGSRLRGRHRMHQRSYLDVKLRLTDHLLGDHGDRMTMANSVEGRYPFLDLDFVRVAMEVPPDLKLHDFEEKYILKRAARGLVPASVAEREKFPFTAQSSAHLVRAAPEFTGDWLSPGLIKRHGVFDPDEVGRLYDACRDPGHRPSTPLRTDWLMIVLTFTILCEQPARADRNTTPCRTPARLET